MMSALAHNINRLRAVIAISAFLFLPSCESSQLPEIRYSTVELKTTMGTIKIELYYRHAPVTVSNFLDYIGAGFYDGTIFHRVIDPFLIQGGQYTPELEKKETKPPIVLESGNGLYNIRGTVAMSRMIEPNSATSQFFINLSDNPTLDEVNAPKFHGYAVFGLVTEGMEVVDAIAGVETSTQEASGGDSLTHVPETPVIILSARLVR